MKSFKLLTNITLDKEYKKDDIVTEKELGTYLPYFDLIGVLEVVETQETETVEETIATVAGISPAEPIMPLVPNPEKGENEPPLIVNTGQILQKTKKSN